MSELIAYTHPQSAFTTQYPAGWKIIDQSETGFANVLFHSPDEKLSVRIAVTEMPEEDTDEAYGELLEAFVQKVASQEESFVAEAPYVDDELEALVMDYEFVRNDETFLATSGLWDQEPFAVLYSVSLPEDAEETAEETLFNIVEATEANSEASF